MSMVETSYWEGKAPPSSVLGPFLSRVPSVVLGPVSLVFLVLVSATGQRDKRPRYTVVQSPSAGSTDSLPETGRGDDRSCTASVSALTRRRGEARSNTTPLADSLPPAYPCCATGRLLCPRQQHLRGADPGLHPPRVRAGIFPVPHLLGNPRRRLDPEAERQVGDSAYAH